MTIDRPIEEHPANPMQPLPVATAFPSVLVCPDIDETGGHEAWMTPEAAVDFSKWLREDQNIEADWSELDHWDYICTNGHKAIYRNKYGEHVAITPSLLTESGWQGERID